MIQLNWVQFEWLLEKKNFNIINTFSEEAKAKLVKKLLIKVFLKKLKIIFISFFNYKKIKILFKLLFSQFFLVKPIEH
jgi:hypothetical protein